MREEVREREIKEKKLRRQLQQSREQLKHLTLNKETQCQTLLGQIAKQEQLLDEVYQEKKGELMIKSYLVTSMLLSNKYVTNDTNIILMFQNRSTLLYLVGKKDFSSAGFQAEP